MTREDDYIQITMEFYHPARLKLVDVGLEWPPPQFIVHDGKGMFREATEDDVLVSILERVRLSSLTDEQMEKIGKHVVRGAEYRWLERNEHKNCSAHSDRVLQ